MSYPSRILAVRRMPPANCLNSTRGCRQFPSRAGVRTAPSKSHSTSTRVSKRFSTPLHPGAGYPQQAPRASRSAPRELREQHSCLTTTSQYPGTEHYLKATRAKSPELPSRSMTVIYSPYPTFGCHPRHLPRQLIRLLNHSRTIQTLPPRAIILPLRGPCTHLPLPQNAALPCRNLSLRLMSTSPSPPLPPSAPSSLPAHLCLGSATSRCFHRPRSMRSPSGERRCPCARACTFTSFWWTEGGKLGQKER
mmetsp:Transcript_1385/g.3842  ORF Transcript_1385/g.3842 Transcript_1385/m.3842 type:complete len:250 (+) Transcript_1385:93-842(+)